MVMLLWEIRELDRTEEIVLSAVFFDGVKQRSTIL
jgi:hypothetical protein